MVFKASLLSKRLKEPLGTRKNWNLALKNGTWEENSNHSQIKKKKNVLLKMMGIINFDLIADHKKKNGIETFVSGT